MQWHGIEDQRAVNSGLPGLARDLGLSLVCTNDVHYLRESDAHAHDVLLCIGTGPTLSHGADEAARPAHGLSMYGDMKYGPGFKHFEYADPKAPKGGAVKLSAIGTFDTLNPFTLRGVPAAGLGQVFDTLMTNWAGHCIVVRSPEARP